MENTTWIRLFNLDLLISLLIGMLFSVIGGHLIINNKIVVKNLLQNVGLFHTREVKRETKEINKTKLVINRIMLYIVGISFFLMGFVFLLLFIKTFFSIFVKCIK